MYIYCRYSGSPGYCITLYCRQAAVLVLVHVQVLVNSTLFIICIQSSCQKSVAGLPTLATLLSPTPCKPLVLRDMGLRNLGYQARLQMYIQVHCTFNVFFVQCFDSVFYSLYSSAIYANRLYLSLMSETQPELLARQQASDEGPCIIGDVRIHPTAHVDPSATVSGCVREF